MWLTGSDIMDWGMLGAIFAMFSLFSGLMVWLVTRIENRLDAHMTSSDNKWTSMNARIDQTQAIIMRMLERQGR